MNRILNHALAVHIELKVYGTQFRIECVFHQFVVSRELRTDFAFTDISVLFVTNQSKDFILVFQRVRCIQNFLQFRPVLCQIVRDNQLAQLDVFILTATEELSH